MNNKKPYLELIQLAKAEDLGPGDVTSAVTIPPQQQGKASLVFRESGILCGIEIVRDVLAAYDPNLRLDAEAADAAQIKAAQRVATIEGPMQSLLASERVVLNFLQRLSGIATLTAQYVKATTQTKAKICDTRKTTPGWRALEKYAVRCGGAHNHRQGLYDAVLIKDNHLAALGARNLRSGLTEAIKRVKEYQRSVDFIEVEVDSLDQLAIVLEVQGVDMVLLDNMTVQQMAQAVQLRDSSTIGQKVLLEASGQVNLATVSAIAASGVDRISVGALTHSARNLDIGLDLMANRHG
ncbi:MAG: carboxylating nicotinate-nucleotide diphosphorylase [Sedimentisphaerales bacterium]|nr:carboxylating nicotinate-nucleotide diphosphorylase [Sedimentisphaerales bacterium]